MTDKKISALTDLGGAPASTDVLPIVDSSANETKKVSVEDLFTNPDVTGTLTADGLTIEQSTTDALVNFKNTNSSTSTQTSSGLALYHNAGSGYAQIVSKEIDASDNFADLQFYYAGGAGGAPKLGMQIASNGDVSLFEDTGITAKFYWDASAESLGLGTSSPAAKLEIGGAGEGIILASPDGTRYEITVANGGTLTVTAV